MLNGLAYDRHEEIEAVETFVESLKAAMMEFVMDPVASPCSMPGSGSNAAIRVFREALCGCRAGITRNTPGKKRAEDECAHKDELRM
jgi:hypothetical protein